jgi:hypothetical protein
MDQRKFRLPVAVVGGIFIACCLPGCQFAYDYEVRGTIKDSASGAPLAGVDVALEASGLLERPTPTVTGNDGSFSLRFRVSDGEFVPDRLPRWSLTLAKEGYSEEVIDVSPSEEPKSPKSKVVVLAYMRAK